MSLSNPQLEAVFSRIALAISTRPFLAGITSLVTLGAAWIVYDKNAWASYGSGGTPPTWAGYYFTNIKLRGMRLFRGGSLQDASPLSQAGSRYISGSLPHRKTPRPALTSWTLPQRQRAAGVTAEEDPALLARLHELVDASVATAPAELYKDLSKTEGRTVDAVYAHPDLPGRDPAAKEKKLGDEIAHVHPQDSSLHVWLSEADAAEVVSKGWGERFPLGALGMCHPGWVFVYSPSNMAEMDVVDRIVDAGIRYLIGRKELRPRKAA